MLSDKVDHPIVSSPAPARLAKVLRIEWLGQTVASVCWIASVFAYGITSAGDYLQLCAASAWLIANIAVAIPAQDN
ncbi:MAG: hypothetical protein AAF333_08910 [Planctomycetota bacterium]